MRWLQWSRYDLEKGIGGVEVHAREVHRGLQALGVDAHLSSRLEDLDEPWAVIHTHGSSILPRWAYGRADTTYVHTLHGTTFGRMWACREFLWLGGYLAQFREIYAVLRSQVVLSVHPRLWLFRLAKWLGKRTTVCGNGWDAGLGETAKLPPSVEVLFRDGRPFWVFVGRGSDPVKGAKRLLRALDHLPEDFRLLAAPGEGFENHPKCFPTGALSPAQVRELMKRSSGLLLPSYYEGLPLVVLEALAQGVPVVAAWVGGMKTLPELGGLQRIGSLHPVAYARAVQEADATQQQRHLWSEENRARLSPWRTTAETCFKAVQAP